MFGIGKGKDSRHLKKVLEGDGVEKRLVTKRTEIKVDPHLEAVLNGEGIPPQASHERPPPGIVMGPKGGPEKG